MQVCRRRGKIFYGLVFEWGSVGERGDWKEDFYI